MCIVTYKKNHLALSRDRDHDKEDFIWRRWDVWTYLEKAKSKTDKMAECICGQNEVRTIKFSNVLYKPDYTPPLDAHTTVAQY